MILINKGPLNYFLQIMTETHTKYVIYNKYTFLSFGSFKENVELLSLQHQSPFHQKMSF